MLSNHVPAVDSTLNAAALFHVAALSPLVFFLNFFPPCRCNIDARALIFRAQELLWTVKIRCEENDGAFCEVVYNVRVSHIKLYFDLKLLLSLLKTLTESDVSAWPGRGSQ